MKRQTNACPDRTPALRSLLAAAGAAILLLGCTHDPVGTAPGGLEPSASSQQSEDPGDSGLPSDGGSGSRAGTDADGGDDSGNGSGSGSGGDSGSGSGSGSGAGG
jgi:hypothetical protein